ncbi:MAG: hypothetical protein Q4B93_04605 [Clostridia bacterium]|nr:hypothetical protein [Clostridia bacterium]
MKKNIMMRVASALFVSVLLSTCAISNTFAKYVSTGSSENSARVAKWGVTVTGTPGMFATKYATDDTSFTLATDTVLSTEDVVAPGTGGTMTNFTITGTPEVAVRVNFEGKLELGDKWKDNNGSYYCPIEITVDDTTFKGTSYASVEEFENAVNGEIAAFSKDYAANTDLSTIGADAPSISWKWAFEGNDNVKDTYLGDQATTEGNAATISLNVTATVTQID